MEEAKEPTGFFESCGFFYMGSIDSIDSIEIVGSRGNDSLLLHSSEGESFWMSRTELLADLETCPQNKTETKFPSRSNDSLRGKIGI